MVLPGFIIAVETLIVWLIMGRFILEKKSGILIAPKIRSHDD
jgi:hypothetical protein